MINFSLKIIFLVLCLFSWSLNLSHSCFIYPQLVSLTQFPASLRVDSFSVYAPSNLRYDNFCLLKKDVFRPVLSVERV